jgi:RNA polymerase sigma factor (sigma-70 family)
MPAVARPAESPYAAYADLLTRPEVRTALWKRVWRLQPADAADLVSESFEALWRRRDDPNLPDSLPRMIGLALRVIDGKVVDRNRRRAVDRKRLVDAARLVPRDEDDAPLAQVAGEDQPNYVDEIAPLRSITAYDHLAARQKLAFVQSCAHRVGLTDDDVEVMQALDADELTVEQAAAERGIPAGALRVRLHRLRQRLGQAWAEQLDGATTMRTLACKAIRLYKAPVFRGRLARGVGTRRWLSMVIQKIVRGRAPSL